jgi:hypothetical protein
VQPAQQAQAPQVVKMPPAVSFSLKTILDGALGNVYALRVQAISSYNEILASKRGEPSLLGMLNRAITDANANPSPQSKVAQLKSSIDSIYAQLKAYNIKDNASASQQPAVRPLPQVPQGQVPQRTSITGSVAQFIEDSKRRGMIGVKSLSDDFLMNAVGAILNGTSLTNANKAMVQEQLMKIADAVMLESLRNDQSITDDQYNAISADGERQVMTFIGKLPIGSRYSYIR